MSKDKKEDNDSGRHSDNDLTEAQQVMKDNDIPFIYSKGRDEEVDDDTDDE